AGGTGRRGGRDGARPAGRARRFPADRGGAGAVIRILLAEDMHMIRSALAALIRLERDLDVVAEVTSGDRIVPEALRTRPDVAVVDIDLPVVDGIAAAAALRAVLPACRVLILTALGQPGHLRRALSAGLEAFLVKDAPGERLA